MNHVLALFVVSLGIAPLGCDLPSAAPPAPSASDPDGVESSEAAGANPSEFYEFCRGVELVNQGFPADHSADGPGENSFDINSNLATGGTFKIVNIETRRGTAAESAAMMRELHAFLRRSAEEKGCQVEGAVDLSDQEATTGFTLKYSKGRHIGEVIVTRTERTERHLLGKDGVPVFTIKVSLVERLPT